MAKFMRTIRDAREDLSNEVRSTSSILSNGYTSGNINDIENNLEGHLPDEDILNDKIKLPQDEKKEMEKKNERKGPGSCSIR